MISARVVRSWITNFGIFCRYVFGDVRYPLPQSVALVEEIVFTQMCDLVCSHILAELTHDALRQFFKRPASLPGLFGSQFTR